MHHLHTLAWLIDKLVDGDPVAWTFFIGTIVLLGVCFIYDLRAAKRKDSSARK
jgi:hypothetical protein